MLIDFLSFMYEVLKNKFEFFFILLLKIQYEKTGQAACRSLLSVLPKKQSPSLSTSTAAEHQLQPSCIISHISSGSSTFILPPPTYCLVQDLQQAPTEKLKSAPPKATSSLKANLNLRLLRASPRKYLPNFYRWKTTVVFFLF